LLEVEDAISLDQLHGMPEAKEWARQLIEDIQLAEKGPLKGGISWNDVDKGALFEGPPGVGKTTIARAIAKSCGLKFISASAAAWQATGYLNNHLAAMRASFALASEYAPSLIFIDEIDSIGNRETFSGDSRQYQTEVVNALLQELDGFEGRQRIIVLAATNFAGNVDPALRRPGRLDRVLNIPYPNVDGLKGIYQHYLSKNPHTLSSDDFEHTARASLGLTGADVELFVRSARRDCRRNGRKEIAIGDLLRQVFRTPPQSLRQPISEAELHRTAIHETGHALMRLLDPDMREGLNYVSIVPRSDGTMGFVASFDPQRTVATSSRYLNNIAMTLAGRAAEAMIFGEENVSLGSGGATERCDLASATRQVEYLLTRQGLGSSSKLLWRNARIEDSAELREQANYILQEQYQRARQCLETHRTLFDSIVGILLTKQEVTGAELRQIPTGSIN
jgi:ATP-dependent Zn protease